MRSSAARSAEPMMPSSSGQSPLTAITHVTVPCADLRVAEEFYVGLLGARVVVRVDADKRRTLGWPDAEIEAKASDHVGVRIGDSRPRLDLFDYPAGIPVAAKHPHIGLAVAPPGFHGWRQRLLDHGVPVVGPRRLGPPGQASLYFNDPFGNHLEIHTDGIDTAGMPLGGPADDGELTYRWRNAKR